MKISDAGKMLLLLVLSMGLVFAATGTTGATQINELMGDICDLIDGLLPIFAFVLFALAAVSYAAGQFFGAETRAKAVGWAMNMIIGAIIAFVIYIVAPIIISALYGTGGATKCSEIPHTSGWG
jgi:hypothetical protein